MSFQAIRTSLLFVLGIQPTENPPAPAAQDAADALNRAMQTLWLASQDYFTREMVNVTVTANTNAVPLEGDIQTVLGPIYDVNTGRALRVLGTRSDYDHYGQLYQSAGRPDAMLPGPPRALFVQQLRGPNAADPVAITLLLQPVPAGGTTLSLHCVRVPPAYIAAQFAPGQSPSDPPVPDNYVESLLLPLARSFLVTSRYFTDTGRTAIYQADAARASAQLGMADSAPPAVLDGSAKARATTAARQAARSAYQKSLAGEATNQ